MSLLVPHEQLLGIRVETVSGTVLGRLAGFVVDAATGVIVQYRVRPRGVIAALVPRFRELLIAHEQVVHIDTVRLVVRDGATRDTPPRRVRPRLTPQSQPAAPITTDP